MTRHGSAQSKSRLHTPGIIMAAAPPAAPSPEAPVEPPSRSQSPATPSPSTAPKPQPVAAEATSNYGSPQEHFQRVLQQIDSAKFAPEHQALLTKAFEYAARMHSCQYRHSGELYIHHPLEVCAILSEFCSDPYALVAAILHDTVEDTPAHLDELKDLFGDVVTDLVAGLTKVAQIKFQSKHEKLAENFRRMVLAMAKDLRVVVIKLCDRLHNMRTIEVLDDKKAKRIAKETLDIYAPLANRLGVYGLKNELEDLCLKILKPAIYEEIALKVARKKHKRKSELEQAQGLLQAEIARTHLSGVEVSGRPKHFYSIYKKMVNRKLIFEEIYDLMAFRVLVSSVKDCYEVLGLVHALWKPKPGRFKDYIAMPKANHYQSLHTTVVGPKGALAEIQIRTHDMHQICEYGVTAHWLYKEVQEGKSHQDPHSYSWLRQILEWQKDVTDSAEYIKALKVDLFEHEIFVFSPMGDVFRLPENATALDFAFSIHSGLGLRTRAAKVNQRMVSLRHKLKSGDVVEIMTSPQQRPGKNWPQIVTTAKAKSKIRSYLRSEERASAKKLGQEVLTQALDTYEVAYEKFIKNSKWLEIAFSMSRVSRLDDLLIHLGFGKITCEPILARIFPAQPKSAAAQGLARYSDRTNSRLNRVTAKKSHITVSGLDHVLVSIAQCCHPVPGDDILGYVTRGRGVTVHRLNCEKALNLDPQRRIEVRWSETATNENTHIVHLRVETKDKRGLASEVTSCISATGANILKANIQVNQDMRGVFQFKIGVKSTAVLEGLMTKLERLPEVIAVQRA